jgi:uncharacterized membrane protein
MVKNTTYKGVKIIFDKIDDRFEKGYKVYTNFKNSKLIGTSGKLYKTKSDALKDVKKSIDKILK